MLCKVCGAQIPDNSSECEFCGAKTGAENLAAANKDIDDATKIIASDEIKNAMASASEEKEEIFDENEKKRREQMQKMLEDKKRQLSEIERRRNEKRQKQKRNKILLIALICALAVGAAGVGAYYVSQNVNSGGSVDTPPVPEATQTASTPAPIQTIVPVSEPAMSPAPNDTSANAQNSNSEGRSWTAANGGSSSSQRTASNTSSQRSASASSGSSSGNVSNASSSSGGSSQGASSSSASVSNSGIVSYKLSSQLVTGGEVIYNSGTGRYLMTFTSGGTRYYANVSEGSTTEQIQNKPYTINAEPTQESYNGNTVYEITSMTNYSGDYLLENSGTKLLTENDIEGMSKYDLALARNEIYARHGRKFQTAEYNTYFSSKSWYTINPNYNYSDDDSNLNEIEAKNVQFLLNAEKIK